MGLALFLLFTPSRMTAEHRDTWTEVQSPHFTVLSNTGESDGRSTALQFEEIRALFQHLYPELRVDSGKPTIIFAIRDEDSLKLFIPSYRQNSKSMRIGGFYHLSYDKNFAVIRMDIRRSGSLEYRALYHEYTHAFFRYNFRGLPLWLDEGLAEYYGNTEIESKEANVGMPNGDDLRLLKKDALLLLPVDQLVTIDSTSPLYNTEEHAGIFYAESWALVHYLKSSPDVRDQDLINKYLHALHATDDPVEAARQSFGDLKTFSKNLDSYINDFSFQYGRVPLQSKLSEKDFTARTLTPAEGALAQADFLLRAGYLPEGLEQLHQVDSAAPGYHSEFGHYHLLKADYDNAAKELQLAIAANPDDISAHIDMAELYLHRDGYTADSTPKIRLELEKVLTLSPDFAPAHAFLSIAYAQDPDKDTNKALKSAIRASQLQPGNLAYFIDVGKAQLAAGSIPQAKQIAETALKTATTSNDRKMAVSFTKEVDYKVSHPQVPPSSRSADEERAADDDTVSNSTEGPAHVAGQITELLCGRPPEVLFTLTTGANSLLLHVSDIAKISIQAGGKASDVAEFPCSRWKDRHVKVDYRATSSGIAQGEVQAISLE